MNSKHQLLILVLYGRKKVKKMKSQNHLLIDLIWLKAINKFYKKFKEWNKDKKIIRNNILVCNQKKVKMRI